MRSVAAERDGRSVAAVVRDALDRALGAPARMIVEAVADGGLRATTTVEVLQEFTHVRAHRRGSDDAARLARAFGDLLEPLLGLVESDLDRGLDIWRGHESLGAFDAVLAAAAVRVGARALVSADRAFAALADPPYVALADDATSFGLGGVPGW